MTSKSDLSAVFASHARTSLEGILRSLQERQVRFSRAPNEIQKWMSDPAWQMMPLAIRLLGMERFRWQEFCAAVARQVLTGDGGSAELKADWPKHLAATVKQWTASADKPANAPPTSNAMPVKKQKRNPDLPFLGIDLGTTYSVVAYLDPHGRPICIPNLDGEMLTPSAVFFDDAGPIIGKSAIQAGLLEPNKLAECVKRDMGENNYRKPIAGNYMPPEVISSMVLRSLAADATRALGAVNDAVITVPAYFDEPRRKATMDAGRLAGLHVVDILNEPTAAAIAYGYSLGFLNPQGSITASEPLRVLVFDLGGGTFDVTIVEMSGQNFRAIATDGDVQLGGKDWDAALADIAVDKFAERIGSSFSVDEAMQQELVVESENAKRALTTRTKAALQVNFGGRRQKVEVTREEFEAATKPLLWRTRSTAEIVVRQANLSWSDIDHVLLVGGSCRMPMVPAMLTELTGQAPKQSVSLDEAVAHGAAIYANLVRTKAIGREPAFRVTNINSHSLGIATIDPQTNRVRNHVLIPRNSALPTEVVRKFVTYKPGQRSAKIQILEGESENPDACTNVGKCVLRDLPEDLPVGFPIAVKYEYEESGRLKVSARLSGTKNTQVSSIFERDSTLTDGDLLLWTEYVECLPDLS